MIRILQIGAILVVILGALSVISDKPFPKPEARQQAEPVKQVVAIDKSSKMQAKRKALIKKLIDAGVFQKVATPGDLPRVYVLPAFYALVFDTKQQFVSVVYAYHFDGTNEFRDIVRVFDALTNKSIGTYTIGRGLDLD